MSWSKQAAFDRGSFSTLLGIEYNAAHACLEVMAIGDSLAILIDAEELVASWPYSRPEQFNERPVLLSTNPVLNGFVGEDGFYRAHQRTWTLDELSAPTLMCVTDALGQWVLAMHRDGKEVWKSLLTMEEESALEALVLVQRAEKQMRIDDSTLLVIRFDAEP
jgi:hypothetical protein